MLEEFNTLDTPAETPQAKSSLQPPLLDELSAVDTPAETPQATASLQPPPPVPPTAWERRRGLLIDALLVAGLVAATWLGWMNAELAAPTIGAILMAHAQPNTTAAKTALVALSALLPKLLHRRP